MKNRKEILEGLSTTLESINASNEVTIAMDSFVEELIDEIEAETRTIRGMFDAIKGVDDLYVVSDAHDALEALADKLY